MKTYAALLALALAASVVSTANAAKHHVRHHHVARVAQPAAASTSDWPGNPYMDLRQSQVEKFWRDAFDPYDATAK
jgi:hypothetical protein